MQTYITYGVFSFDSSNGYPVPNFSISMEQERTTAGSYLSSNKIISLEGVVYTQKMTAQNSTSTNTNGTTSILTLFQKASGLKTAILQNNNSKLTIGCGGSLLIAETGAVKSISFSENENKWSYAINYTIEIAIPSTGMGSEYHISSMQDNCRLEVLDDQMYYYNNQLVPSYQITRTLGATGKSIDKNGALYQAKKWIAKREQQSPITGIFLPKDFPLYNHNRNVSISETDGTYTVTDTFISKSGDPWIDTRTYELSVDTSNNGRRQVVINGTIQGLQPATAFQYNVNTINVSGIGDISPLITGINTYKYQNAVSGYANITGTLYDAAAEYNKILLKYSKDWSFTPPPDDCPLNTIALSAVEGLDPAKGTITYSRTYDSRPPAVTSGAVSETINISDNKPVEAISEVFVIGRRLGPVILSTTNSSGIGVKTVTYEAVFPTNSGLRKYTFPQRIKNDVNRFISGLMPLPPLTGFVTEDKETINLTENRLTRTVTWQYTTCNNT